MTRADGLKAMAIQLFPEYVAVNDTLVADVTYVSWKPVSKFTVAPFTAAGAATTNKNTTVTRSAAAAALAAICPCTRPDGWILESVRLP